MKSHFFALYKIALARFFIEPLFYISSIVVVIFCAFRFFFVSRFFVLGVGSTDLRTFFSSFLVISILILPLFALRLRPLIFDDSLPISPEIRFCALFASQSTAFFVPMVLLSSIPLSVSFFGDVDAGQTVAGYIGIFLYVVASSGLSIFLFSAFEFSSAVPFILSVAILVATASAHLIPLYLNLGGILGGFLQKISFFWQNDPFSKGIIDTQSIAFYFILIFALIFLSSIFEKRRTGRKFPHRATIFVFLSFILLFLSSEMMSKRFDLTKAKRFSVSETTKSLLQKAESPIRITYYRSPELSSRYPQTNDVISYLSDFCRFAKGATFSVQKAEPEKLSALGIRGQSLRNETSSRVEFLTVYSAVVLHYAGNQSVIPFVLSTDTLEYDLSQRISRFISKKERTVLVFAGNDRSISENYHLVLPWLSSRGFSPTECDPESAVQEIQALQKGDSLLILGSSAILQETALEIEKAISRDVGVFVATSPYTVPIENAWEISRSDEDFLIPILEKRGIEFGDALVQDVSCVPATFQSLDNSSEFITVNNPQWLSILPQKNAVRGLSLFWASPILLDDQAESILETSDFAWIQEESGDKSNEFLTDASSIPKSAHAADAVAEKICVCARNKNLSVLSDQYFVDSTMTGFISGESVDLRNFEFLSAELLRLRGEEKLAELMEKSRNSNDLYKILDEEKFFSARTVTIFVNFALLPFLLLCFWILSFFIRRKIWNIKK